MPNTNERDALTTIANFPITDPANMDAVNMQKIALAAREACFTPATAPNAAAPYRSVVEVCPECDIADCRHIRGRRVSAAPNAGAPLSRQQVHDRFSFLEGLVSEEAYRKIADTAIEIQRTAGASIRDALDAAPTLSDEAANAIHRVPYVRDCLLAYRGRPADPEAVDLVKAIAAQLSHLAAAPAQQAGAPLPLAPSEPDWWHCECDDADYSRLFGHKADALSHLSDHPGKLTALDIRATPPQATLPASEAVAWIEAAVKWARLDADYDNTIGSGGVPSRKERLDLFEAQEGMEDCATRLYRATQAPSAAKKEGQP